MLVNVKNVNVNSMLNAGSACANTRVFNCSEHTSERTGRECFLGAVRRLVSAEGAST